MKKILSVSNTTLKLFFRGGAAWGLMILSSLFAAFIFFSAGADDILLNELRVRIEYSLTASTILLNLALIYFSCVSLRKEIDERRFHTISAAPVSRSAIWLGKFLGLLILGAATFLMISLSIAASSAYLIFGWTDADQVADLKTNFFRSYRRRAPDLAELNRDVAKTYAEALRLKKEEERKRHHAAGKSGARGDDADHERHHHHHHHHHDEWEGAKWRSRKALLALIRKSKQLIAPGETKSWKFYWDPKSNLGESVLLRFKFYANRKRSESKGVWTISDADGREVWTANFKGYPFIEHELRIPSDKMPKTASFKLAYKVADSTYVIFPVYSGGITISYDDRSVFANFCALFMFALAHMAVLVALALMFSAMFSYSVAVFSATSLYAVAAFSGFFHHVLTDLSFHDQTLSTRLFTFVIKAGLWLAEGAKELPVKDFFAKGVSIPVLDLAKAHAAGFAVYLLLVVLIGTFTLTRKEIDKILQA